MADDAAINDEEAQYQYPEYGAGAAPPDPETDNSGAAPVAAIPDDNSGAGPAAPAGGSQAIQTDEDLPRTGPNGPIARGVKGIISYLMGAGAAHPDVIDKAAAEADPHGSMSPGDRNIMAVHNAGEMDGPAAAWGLVQANRVAYNAKQAFAYAALNGNQQKPPDLNAAIQAANQAGDHVLDGTSVTFAPASGGDGVTATVMNPQSDTPQQFNLSKQAFAEYLNVGKTGQWDRLMQDGISGTLQKLAAQQPDQGLARFGYQPQNTRAVRPSGPPPRKQINFGNTPSTMNLSGNQDAIPESEQEPASTYTPEQEQRSRARFPWASQEGQRQASMQADQQRADELENKVEVASEKGKNDTERARITAGGRVAQEGVKQGGARDVAGIKADAWKYSSDAKTRAAEIAHDARNSQQGDKAAQQRMETARKTIASIRATGGTLTPEQIETEKMLSQVPQGAQAPQAQHAGGAHFPTQQEAAPPAPTEPAQRKVGQIYSSPTGKRGKWMGNGWQAVN